LNSDTLLLPLFPAVPWGVATSFLAGSRPVDFLLFTGIAVYALVGCAAQDLRVLKKEGSVGTVFEPFSTTSTGSSLQLFFQSTSFIPFGAVVDGRQSLDEIVSEFPLLPFLVFSVAGYFVEAQIVSLL
jgi:uncharacterized membrane protein